MLKNKTANIHRKRHCFKRKFAHTSVKMPQNAANATLKNRKKLPFKNGTPSQFIFHKKLIFYKLYSTKNIRKYGKIYRDMAGKGRNQHENSMKSKFLIKN